MIRAPHFLDLLRNAFRAGKIVKRLFGHADDVVGNERRAPSAAPSSGCFRQHSPFQHGPGFVIVLRKLGENAGEIHLTVTQRVNRPARLIHGW